MLTNQYKSKGDNIIGMLYGGNWFYSSSIDKQIGCKPIFKPTIGNNEQHQSDIDRLSHNIDRLTTWIIILVIMLIIHIVINH